MYYGLSIRRNPATLDAVDNEDEACADSTDCECASCRDAKRNGEAAASSLGLGDSTPLLKEAVAYCKSELDRLAGSLKDKSNPATASAAAILAETGVSVDANPYFGIDTDQLTAVIRAAYHARTPPEVLLAIWAKEGSAKMTTSAITVSQATSAANARTIARSGIYYVQLGADMLTVTTRPDPNGDNILDETDAGAAAQEKHFKDQVAQLVTDGVLSEDISGAVNGELTTNAKSPFTVTPSVKFYGLSLLLVDAIYQRLLRSSYSLLPGGLTNGLAYMLWNMGDKSFKTFLTSADNHRQEKQFRKGGNAISIEEWAFHTKPAATEYKQSRANAIRFQHYIKSYAKIFSGAMNLITPGIEDLMEMRSHIASLSSSRSSSSSLGGPSARGLAGGHPVTNLDGFMEGRLSPLEDNSGGGWIQNVFRSRLMAAAVIGAAQYADMKSARKGLVRDVGVDAYEMRLRGRLVVPRGLKSRTKPVPVVAITTGNHPAFDFPVDPGPEILSHTGYDYLQQALADAGFASISVDTNAANDISGGIGQRAFMTLETLKFLASHAAKTDDLKGKLDFKNIGLVGHSRGGDAVVLAALRAPGEYPDFKIRGVFSIAPTDFSRDATTSLTLDWRPFTNAAIPLPLPIPDLSQPAAPFTLSGDVRFGCLYGSHDGDVVGQRGDGTNSGFSIYDRASCSKSFFFCRGITHNRFNTVWNECADYADGLHSFVTGDCTVRSSTNKFDPFIFSAQEHRDLAVFYVGAFLERVLLGDASKEDILRGKKAINAKHAIAVQWSVTDALVVDELEGTNASRATTGGSIVDMIGVDASPNTTKAFKGVGGDKVRFTLGGKDLHDRKELTFRLTSEIDVSTLKTIQAAKLPTFKVRLETAAGTATVTDADISRAGILTPDKPFFHQPIVGNVSKRHFDTIVIPLSAFAKADLRDVRAVELEIGAAGTTPAYADSFLIV